MLRGIRCGPAALQVARRSALPQLWSISSSSQDPAYHQSFRWPSARLATRLLGSPRAAKARGASVSDLARSGLQGCPAGAVSCSQGLADGGRRGAGRGLPPRRQVGPRGRPPGWRRTGPRRTVFGGRAGRALTPRLRRERAADSQGATHECASRGGSWCRVLTKQARSVDKNVNGPSSPFLVHEVRGQRVQSRNSGSPSRSSR